MQILINDMSLSNPTLDEAAEAYAYYKNKYYNAASEKKAAERKESAYLSERNSATSQRDSLLSQKINLEKRLGGIEKIISMLEGNGGWFTADVPKAISKATTVLARANESYQSSIRVEGGVAAASLESTFAIATVETEANSASALQKYKAEKMRLEQQIAEMKTQIATLSDMISSLNSKISACNDMQDSLRAIMNVSAYEMNHYRSHMY